MGIAMKDLLEAGVHFGHQTKRWNPKMKEFIFGERNGIYIIDLGKTVKLFGEAETFISNLAADGRTILFVGTKRQAQDVIAEEAQRCNMFFVNERWLGGLLTNFATIQRSLGRLRDLEAMTTDGRRKEKIAVDEARKLKIPVLGIVDTNCDPDEVDFVIPGNDDALRAIRLFASRIADAVLAGRDMRQSAEADNGADQTGDPSGSGSVGGAGNAGNNDRDARGPRPMRRTREAAPASA